MTDFPIVDGFEDIWRAPARPRRIRPEEVLDPGARADHVRARLRRIVERAPEVMVKVTGRTRDPGHLQAHLRYITRNGELEAESREGWRLAGRVAVDELAADWAAMAQADSRRRSTTPYSLSVVLSMPRDTDAIRLLDAARSFARATFAERFDHVLVLHTDRDHPHVHLTLRALGDNGERLNPRKADLAEWREEFARALRDQGVIAEATPRRARGVTRKAERAALRRMRERQEAGKGAMSRRDASAIREAARAAFLDDVVPRAWETASARRQQRVRSAYRAQARLLAGSSDPEDRRLALLVDRFVNQMPAPDARRLALARRLRDLGGTRRQTTKDRER